MLTLQTTFSYDDGHSTPPVDKATIVVSHPTYSLPRAVEAAAAAPVLIATGHVSSQLRQRLLDKHYSLSIPIASVFGLSYADTLAGHLGPILRTGRLDLADVTLKFEVNYGTSGDVNGQLDTIETLYFFKLLKPLKPDTPAVTSGSAAPGATPGADTIAPHTAVALPAAPSLVLPTGPVLSSTPASSPTAPGQATTTPSSTIPIHRIPDIIFQHPDWLRVGDRSSTIDANLYLVSKTVYKSFLTQLFPNLLPENEAILLYLVNALVDLSGSSPALSDDSETYQRSLVNEILTFYHLPLTNNVYEFLTTNFMKLFDMPLHMPKFKLLSIAGKIRFRNPPAIIPFDDFVFYHLSSEYTVMLGDTQPQFHSTRYAWDKGGYANNAINFSYTEKAVLTSVRSRVVLRVKAFDQSELYRADFDPEDPILQQLDIVIDIRMPPALGTISSVDGSSGQKLRGKIVPVSKSCTLKGSVVIQAKKQVADTYWQTVSAGMSDKTGNFSLPYPAGQYAAAQAITSLDMNHPTPISVDAHSTTTSISSDFLFILLQFDNSQGSTSSTDSATDQKSPDCNCNPQNLAGRLPSHDDLINSDQYTQDLGGGCINLTVPNRTLREYQYTALVRSSDPDIASYTLQSALNDQFVDVYQLIPNGKVNRSPVDLDNPVRWQDGDDTASTELTVYQSVTIATGVILYYKSEFRADGYSLGDLVYSLPLAPGQKKQIVVVDASSTMVGTEQQNVSQSDTLANNLLSERSIIDNIAGNLGETLSGQSNASTAGISAGLGAAGSAGFLGASLGVSGGYSNSNSSASQDSKRGLSEHFSEVLRQGLVQRASDYRQMNASAVTTVNDRQKYNADTEVVANHNHCHSITMMYFEVLRHFAIFQELVDVEECVFVPLLMARFTIENVMKWADMLCTRMLPIPSNTFVRPASFGGQQIHSLVPAFDALERWRTTWELVDFPKGPYDEEIIQEVQGDLLFKIDIPRPKTRYDFIMSYPIMATAVSRQVTDAQSLKDSFVKSVFTLGFSLFGDDGSRTETEIQNLPTKIVDAFIQIDDNFASVPPAQAIRVISFEPRTVDGKVVSPMDYAHTSNIDKTMWQSYAALLGYANSPDGAKQMMIYYFQGQLLSEWDTIWNRNIAPELYKSFLKTITLSVGGSLTTLDAYYGGERYMTAFVNGSAASQTRKDVANTGITIKCTSSTAISLNPSPVAFVLLRMNLTYDTAHYHGTLWTGTIDANMLEPSTGAGGPVSSGVTKSAPERADEKRNPRNEDIFMGNKLLQHLNSNMEYYNRVLWSNLDANRRFMLLDGFQIETFDQYGMSEGFRSLASVLKNTLIAVVGNSLVLPVAPGYKVSQNLIVKRDSAVQTESLLDHFRPTISQPPYRLSVPTRGVFAEAVMGSCNACEAVQPNTSQDWTKFTTDEPTAINPVAPALPAPATYNPQIKDLAAPIVNVQNAPTMPDPAAGLAAVTSLLGKPDAFRDVTGLSGTQQTALQTLLSDNGNAKAFAQMASSMVTQGHNTANSSSIMGTIKGAQSDGTLSQKDAGQLVKDHIQQQIDGGATKKADLAQQASQGKPSIPGAAVSAATSGKNVKATRTQASDGTVSESMEISEPTASSSNAAGSSGSAQAQVKGTIELVQQAPKSNGCWAAAATMMVSWLQKKSMTVEDVLKLAGGTYLDKWTNNETLSASEKDDFLGSLGLVGEGPASNPPSQYIAWMNKYGPLWVTVDNGIGSAWSPHAKILTQITSDDVSDGANTTMYFLDPSKSNATTSSFTDFERSFEEVARDSPNSTLGLQVVHFGEPLPTGEGYEIEGPWNYNEPVHESITLTAMVQSTLRLSSSTQLWQDPTTNELLRGIVWPDDPMCMMFDDDENDDANFASGLLYGITFKWGNANSLLKRSHFGDLQFLHAMGSSLGEMPNETVAKIKVWAETMYRTALGGFTGSTTLASIPVATNSGKYTMNSLFERSAPAAKSMTLKQLLTANTKYRSLDLKRRALGALLHTIEDSYAHGHTRRVLLNPLDVLSQTPTSMTFKAGTYGKWGAVQNFHNYPNANHDSWDSYDKSKMNIGDPASFNDLVGARDAIDKVTKMINFWAAGTAYDQGPRDLVEKEIFAVDSAASGSDRTS